MNNFQTLRNKLINLDLIKFNFNQIRIVIQTKKFAFGSTEMVGINFRLFTISFRNSNELIFG